MRVIAAPGLRVPLEGKARQFIEHDPDQPVDVPDTPYYRRRLASGELRVASVDSPATTDTTAAGSAKKAAKANEEGAV